MEMKNCKDEIIQFVLHSTDQDNRMIAAFIAGMLAKEQPTHEENAKDEGANIHLLK